MMAEAAAPLPKAVSARNQPALVAGLLAFLLLLVLLLYTFFHEGGHALLGLLFGGKITAFNVNFFNLSAHVGIDGDFSRTQNALIAAAGVSLPLVLGMAFILLARREGDVVHIWFKLLVFAVAVNPLLAWMVIPFLVQAGQTVGDDSANFMGYTQASPALIGGAALLVYLICWAVFLKRAGGARGLTASLRQGPVDLSQPSTRRTLFSLIGVGALVGAATLALTVSLPKYSIPIPAGYQLAVSLDLSQKAYAEESVYAFSLRQPAQAGFFITLQDVKGGPLAIKLVGPDGYANSFFVDPNPKLDAGLATVHPRDLPLAAGDYQLIVNAPHSAGEIKVYAVVE